MPCAKDGCEHQTEHRTRSVHRSKLHCHTACYMMHTTMHHARGRTDSAGTDDVECVCLLEQRHEIVLTRVSRCEFGVQLDHPRLACNANCLFELRYDGIKSEGAR